MTKRPIAATLALTLGLAACGTGAEPAAVPQTAPDSDAGLSSSADASRDEEAATSTTIAAADPTASEPTRADNGQPNRLKSSLLGAAVEQVALTSARFEASIEVVSEDPEMPGTFSLSFSGGYDVPNRSTTLEMDLSSLADALASSELGGDDGDAEAIGAMLAEPMRVITIDEMSWVQGGFFSFFGIEPGMWLEMETADSDEALDDFASMGAPLNPTDFLAEFEDANVEISELGSETLRGVETTHYLAEIDIAGLADLAEERSPEEQADFEESLSELGDLETLEIEFWVGDDGLLRRMDFNLDASELPDNEGIVSMTMTFEMFDYGADLGIVPPDASLVVDEGSFASN